MERPDSPADDRDPDTSMKTLQVVLGQYPTPPAPIGSLLRQGHNAQRRRRGRALAAGVAAVLVVVGALSIGLTSRGSDETPIARDPNTTGHSYSAGAQVFGIGRVAITVPDGWTLNTADCNAPDDKTVFFPVRQRCDVDAPSVSAIAITSQEPTVQKPAARDRGATVDGHTVLEGPQRCSSEPNTPPGAIRPQCTLTFGVPDLNAWFRAKLLGNDSEDLMATIRGSLEVLPETQVAVPPTNDEDLDTVTARVRDLGLNPVVKTVTCSSTANCYGPAVIDNTGTVVDIGTNVTITSYNTGAAPTVTGPASCAPPALPIVTLKYPYAQTQAAPTVERALQNLLPDTDLSGASYEPLGASKGAPVWVRVGNNTYMVQANSPGQWAAKEATFDGCSDPNDMDRQ